MNLRGLPITDLAQLEAALNQNPPEFAVPRNLPMHWLALLARDSAVFQNCQDDELQHLEGCIRALMCVTLRVLSAQRGRPMRMMDLSEDEQHRLLTTLRLELVIEAIRRQEPGLSVEPASLETLFTDRRLRGVIDPAFLGKEPTSARRLALKKSLEICAAEGTEPTKYGRLVFQRWVDGLPLDKAVGMLREYHQELERGSSQSDRRATSNPLGITDSGRLKDLKADLRALRSAQIELGSLGM